MLYFFLAGDVVLTFVVAMIHNKYLHLPTWKLVAFSIVVVPVGLFCAKLMRLIEAGTWEGMSFYGAVFFAPLLMVPFGLLLKIKPADMLDLGGPSGCVALAFLKIQCYITGCCYGMILWYQENGRPVRFPSQIVEVVCGVIVLIVLLMIIRSGKQKGYIYAWFLLLYGGSRFFLNLFRETTPFVFGIPQGCFWSIISVIIGGTVLLIRWRRRVGSDANQYSLG